MPLLRVLVAGLVWCCSGYVAFAQPAPASSNDANPPTPAARLIFVRADPIEQEIQIRDDKVKVVNLKMWFKNEGQSPARLLSVAVSQILTDKRLTPTEEENYFLSAREGSSIKLNGVVEPAQMTSFVSQAGVEEQGWADFLASENISIPLSRPLTGAKARISRATLKRRAAFGFKTVIWMRSIAARPTAMGTQDFESDKVALPGTFAQSLGRVSIALAASRSQPRASSGAARAGNQRRRKAFVRRELCQALQFDKSRLARPRGEARARGQNSASCSGTALACRTAGSARRSTLWSNARPVRPARGARTSATSRTKPGRRLRTAGPDPSRA